MPVAFDWSKSHITISPFIIEIYVIKECQSYDIWLDIETMPYGIKVILEYLRRESVGIENNNKYNMRNNNLSDNSL